VVHRSGTDVGVRRRAVAETHGFLPVELASQQMAPGGFGAQKHLRRQTVADGVLLVVCENRRHETRKCGAVRPVARAARRGHRRPAVLSDRLAALVRQPTKPFDLKPERKQPLSSWFLVKRRRRRWRKAPIVIMTTIRNPRTHIYKSHTYCASD